MIASGALLDPSAAAAPAQRLSISQRTLWGLEPVALHTRYWAAHGVQVVRQGEPSQIVSDAELYMLTDPRSLLLFGLFSVVETLNWIKPNAVFIRLHDTRERGYREKAVTDSDNRFIRFQRFYDACEDLRLVRVVLTPERELAQLWQATLDPLSAWRRLRNSIARHDRVTLSIDGRVYDRTLDREIADYLTDLVGAWKRPDSTVVRAKALEKNIWRDPTSQIDPAARLIGPLWVGAGVTIPAEATVIGPAFIWDDPHARPPTDPIQWLMIEPRDIPAEPAVPDATVLNRALHRLFDIAFSCVAILLTLPLYPFVILAILLEDGRPIWFAHRRETLGGAEFGCLKFRSMRKNAEQLKAQLKSQNQADGPQFFIERDPRLTGVGRILRSYHLDELPQFFNVLVGQMSVVGPRPSPRSENQFCPAWREARLSVRPGITGLWQIRRTRRSGADFQEWIKYDIEYVEKRSWTLDLWIIWETIGQLLRKVYRS